MSFYVTQAINHVRKTITIIDTMMFCFIKKNHITQILFTFPSNKHPQHAFDMSKADIQHQIYANNT